MMDPIYVVGIILIVAVLMFFIGWTLNSKIGKSSLSRANEASEKIIKDAEKEAKNIKREKLLEVKDEWLRKKQDFDTEVNRQRQKLQNYEKNLDSKEENLEKKFDLVIQKEKTNRELEQRLVAQKEIIEKKNAQFDRLIQEQNIRLEKTAALSADEAKKMLMENMVEKAKADASQFIKDRSEEHTSELQSHSFISYAVFCLKKKKKKRKKK